MSNGENERRRSTAREAWLLQLTPEQRGAWELAHQGEVFPASEAVLEAARALDEPYGAEEGAGLLWVPDEPRESLQRSIERRY